MAPLRMAVLGDSVVWGQGLDEPSKFSTQVQHWLQNRLNRAVQRTVLAHSGAVIVPELVRDLDPPTYGEIPNPYPSITYQASRVDAPEAVDIVLLNGGINDLGPAEILNPLDVLVPNRFANLVRVKCGYMNDLLTQTIFPTFNKAIVVVTGYFPLVSEKSDPAEVVKLGCLFRALKPILDVLGALSKPALVKLADKSRLWVSASNAALSAAVTAANQLGTERAYFAPVQFGSEHCYAAPKAWLWKIGDADPVKADRAAACVQAMADGRFTGEPYCPLASAFHPNREGATAYFQAITQAIAPLFP